VDEKEEIKRKFDGKKVKVLVKQIVILTNLYEAGKIGQGTMRITVETLVSEIMNEIEKLGK